MSLINGNASISSDVAITSALKRKHSFSCGTSEYGEYVMLKSKKGWIDGVPKSKPVRLVKRFLIVAQIARKHTGRSINQSV